MERQCLKIGLGDEGKVPAQHHLSLGNGLSGPRLLPTPGLCNINVSFVKLTMGQNRELRPSCRI